MADNEKDLKEMSEMTNAQFNSFLEQLAKLVEHCDTVEQAAQVIRQAKTEKNC